MLILNRWKVMRQKEQRACSQIESNKKRIIIACKDRGMIKESGDAGTIARAAADCLLSATALDSEKNNCAQWTWQVTDLEMSELYCKLDPLEHVCTVSVAITYKMNFMMV